MSNTQSEPSSPPAMKPFAQAVMELMAWPSPGEQVSSVSNSPVLNSSRSPSCVPTTTLSSGVLSQACDRKFCGGTFGLDIGRNCPSTMRKNLIVSLPVTQQ